MDTLDYTYHDLDTAAEYVKAATAHIEGRLKAAMKARGRASLLVSGGASPKPVYAALSQVDMDWENVAISLIDERWVPETNEGSNARFIKNTLLQNYAASAAFLPIVNEAKSAKIGAAALTKVFDKAFPAPIDVCVMGMGMDGHTASWFPGSQTLAKAFEIDGTDSLIWQDATGQMGASGYDDRITTSLPLVMRARDITLLIPGPKKKVVWDASDEKDVFAAPVTTLRAAGPRLHVFTHGEQ